MNALASALVLFLQTTSQAASSPSGGGRAELDQIAIEVQRSLARPIHAAFPDDRRVVEFDVCLTVAGRWPHPGFREPLLKLLEDDDPAWVSSAADALLLYDDPQLEERVRDYVDDARLRPPHVTVGQLVRRAMKEAAAKRHATPRPAPTGLLPLDGDKEIDFDALGFRTIPQAAAALRHENQSIRIQAFTWLAASYIVLDANVLREAWPGLSDSERGAVLCFLSDHAPKWGEERLASVLADLIQGPGFRGMSNRTKLGLFLSLAQVKMRPVPEGLLRRIASFISGVSEKERAALSEDPDSEQAELLETAFAAFGSMAGPTDVDQALRWLESPVPVVRCGALHVLACIDEPRAARAVIQSIRQRRMGSGYYAHPYKALRRREWPDETYRWQYLRAILETLEERLARQPKDRKTVAAHNDEEVRSLPGLVVVLEAIAQVTQGPHGGEAMGMVVDFEALRATTAKWRAWFRENDPAATRPSSRASGE